MPAGDACHQEGGDVQLLPAVKIVSQDDGNLYNPLSIQPIIVLSADEATISAVNRRALERDINSSLFIEEMFATGH
ncbi:DUF2000 family protein, partial [Rhizobium johnstonii]|uniref:DUF2000 family protein n=1 Tax=Rhizobium johnstonii TaxID=3019933 RepID=UPI003F9A61F0